MVALADTWAAALAALVTLAGAFSAAGALAAGALAAGFGDGLAVAAGTALALGVASAAAGAFAAVLVGAFPAGVALGAGLEAGLGVGLVAVTAAEAAVFVAGAAAVFVAGAAGKVDLVLDDGCFTFATFTAGGGGDAVGGLAATLDLALGALVREALPEAWVDETAVAPVLSEAPATCFRGPVTCLGDFRSAPEPDLDVDGELAMIASPPAQGRWTVAPLLSLFDPPGLSAPA